LKNWWYNLVNKVSKTYQLLTERKRRAMDKEFLTYEEAAQELGIKRSTLYSMITQLGIKTQKFRFDKRKYIALADIKRIKEIRQSPWKADEKSVA
jgi:excisionase family DNA binding protein